MPLPDHAALLLSEMARDHKLPELGFDEDGLLAIGLDELHIALAFSEPRNSFFLMAPLGDDHAVKPPLLTDCAALGPPCRQTLPIREPATGAPMLIAELPTENLAYPAFAKAIEDFVTDVERARAEPMGNGAADFPADEFAWIRS